MKADTSTGAVTGKPGGSEFGIGWHMVTASAVMALLVFGGGGWAATANLASAVVGAGTVVVERNVKKVQHLDGGIVAEILVREGERVASGQVVVRLDATQTKAELGVIQSQLVELSGRRVRMLAEREGANEIHFASDFDTIGADAAGVRAGETRLFFDNLKTREAQKQQLGLRIGQLREEIVGLSSQRNAKGNELTLIKKELDSVQDLQRRQLTSITRVYQLEREATRLGGEHGSLTAQLARVQGQISEINLQIISIDQNARTEAQKELRGIEARLSELTERQAAARDRLARVEIRSPQTGIVHELAAHTIGGIITPASLIMSIVPENERLSVDVKLAPTDRDQLVIGQTARLRFTAFNQRTTPEGTGKLIRVAANTSLDPKTGANYYTGTIEVDPSIRTGSTDLKLVPGMPVEVFLATGDRTALSYFIKPLQDQFARAFREE